MSERLDKELQWRLTNVITDAFNRTINALEDAGAIDTDKLRQQYTGVGSKYYDIVTEQIERTVASGAPWIAELFASAKRSGQSDGD